MIESGKQEPAASPAAKTGARGEQTPAPQSANRSLRKQETILSQLPNKPSREEDTIPAQSISLRTETAFTKLATGFDFPVGIPDAQGYYNRRAAFGHTGIWEKIGMEFAAETLILAIQSMALVTEW